MQSGTCCDHQPTMATMCSYVGPVQHCCTQERVAMHGKLDHAQLCIRVGKLWSIGQPPTYQGVTSMRLLLCVCRCSQQTSTQTA